MEDYDHFGQHELPTAASGPTGEGPAAGRSPAPRGRPVALAVGAALAFVAAVALATVGDWGLVGLDLVVAAVLTLLTVGARRAADPAGRASIRGS